MPVCHSCQSSEAHSSSFFLLFFFITFCPSQKSTSSNSFSFDFILRYPWLCSFHHFNFNLLTVFDFTGNTFAFQLDTPVLMIVLCSSQCFSSPHIFKGFPPSGNWKLLVEVVWVARVHDLLVVGGSGVTFRTLAYSAALAIWIVGSSKVLAQSVFLHFAPGWKIFF